MYTFPNVLECRDHRQDLPTIWKTRFLQANIELSTYESSGSSLEQPLEYNPEKMLLKNHLFHQLSYKNSIQFPISSRRQSR